MKRLTLVLPGVEGLAELREGSAALKLDLPAWARIDAKADREQWPVSGYEAALFQLFGMTSKPAPVAAVTVTQDLPDSEQAGVWLRADPVYLRADRDHLRFFDAHVLELTQQEAETLAAEIGAIYADLGWQLHVAAPDRWYLRVDAEPDLVTVPPSEIVGRVVDPFLPTGPERNRWHALMTEMQMVLHMSEVNARRERQGRLPVNSVWFWGNGPSPTTGGVVFDGRLTSDDPLAIALAHYMGMEAGSLNDAENPRALTAMESILVDHRLLRLSLYAEAERWQAEREALEQRWIEPGLAALHARQIDELRVIGSSGNVWRLRRRHLWRFWRR
ncbi:MAG: hypothetical protein H6981_01880 [Gammaproteobacteria bacterium]|nr:hypothetical protein [Gammaproteobacteria bacterium]MCP5135538.1 hypothetical protein [Gammaproteobacteria bacterium]